MGDGFSEFWQSTWSAWRSGTLSLISQNYKKFASDDYEHFIKTSKYVKHPLISKFFTTYSPLPGEFLIAFAEMKTQLAMVLTNQRLWMFDKHGKEYIGFSLKDIVKFKSTRILNSYNVLIHFRDDTKQNYAKMVSVPSDQAIRFAIKQNSSTTEFEPSSSTTQIKTQIQDVTQTQNETQLQNQPLHQEQESTQPITSETQPQNPIVEALSAGALAGVGAGLAAHYLAGGKLTFGIWIVAYILVITNVKNKTVATIVFVICAALVSTILGDFDPSK